MSFSPDAHGVHTIPKGECGACGQAIVGQVGAPSEGTPAQMVVAMGRSWHPEHFCCCECGRELGRAAFFERGGKAFCEQDYHALFLPRCAHCDGPIKEVGGGGLNS